MSSEHSPNSFFFVFRPLWRHKPTFLRISRRLNELTLGHVKGASAARVTSVREAGERVAASASLQPLTASFCPQPGRPGDQVRFHRNSFHTRRQFFGDFSAAALRLVGVLLLFVCCCCC